MNIYISLPISGREKEAREKADRVRAMLSSKGLTPVNPFEIYTGEGAEYFDHICYDLRALADCEAVFLCEGWEHSKGCLIEKHFAETYGKRVYYEVQPLFQNLIEKVNKKKNYRIRAIGNEECCNEIVVQMYHRLFGWITVKSFSDDDMKFAYREAEELLEKLNEK